jgi:alkanesulfonate monooxygenase SsuD/methylene tetrahydromethanopterin reductase-like flavin-dependent oxidoreductase (luciferase family)
MDLALQVVGDYDHVLNIARIAQGGGAVAVSLADHYLYGTDRERYTDPTYDSLIQAAALGRDTTDLEIVMLVSPITFRHPAFYAKGAITIDELSGGRFVLGVGTGWHDDEHEFFGIPYPDRHERFGMLEDALGYLRQFFDDPQKGFESDRYTFEGLGYRPRARSDLRILVGGKGEKRTPRLAGTFGGEFSIAETPPEGVAGRIARAKEAAAANGRDPDALLISMTAAVISGATDAEITDNLDRFGESTGRSGQEMREQWERRGLAFRTWEEHLEWFGQFAAAGVERVYIQLATRVADHAAECLEQFRGI